MTAAGRGDRAPMLAGRVAAGVGLAVLVLKVVAALRTGSLALMADATESAVNLVAALIAVSTWREAARAGHAPEIAGHGRLEFLSAAIEGGFVVLATFVVVFDSIARFGQMPRVTMLGVGLLLALSATAASAILVRYLLKVGHDSASPTLLADALHLRSDVITSLLVYLGLGIAWGTGTWTLDGWLALGVAIHILVAGMRAVRHSVTGVVNEDLSGPERAAIERRLRDEGPPVVGFGDLRTRRSGSQVSVDFRLVISRYALVYEAHEICARMEADLRRLQPGARVGIRVEPEAGASGLDRGESG